MMEEETLVAYLDETDPNELEAIAEERIAIRGRTYYQNKAVKKLHLSDHKIEAEVQGSTGTNYQITIWHEQDNGLEGTCTCPYDDICKHMIAVLLEAKARVSEPAKQQGQARLTAMLQNLPRDELVSLVLEFAPQRYKTKLLMQHATPEESLKGLYDIRTAMKQLLGDEEMLFTPFDFQDVVSELVEMLDPFWSHHPEASCELLFWFAEQIETYGDQGYLYQENYRYGEDEYFDFEDFSGLLPRSLSQISDPQIRTECGLKYALFCTNSDSFWINYEQLGIEPRPFYEAGKTAIRDIRFYDYIKQALTLDEKLAYLSKFSQNEVSRHIIEAHKTHGDPESATQKLRAWLAEEFKEEYAAQLIQMRKASPEEICGFLDKSLQQGGFRAREFVLQYLKQCPQSQEILDQNEGIAAPLVLSLHAKTKQYRTDACCTPPPAHG
jgi:hypothetical protein